MILKRRITWQYIDVKDIALVEYIDILYADGILDIEDDLAGANRTPSVFSLAQNYPNPFNPDVSQTTIVYQIGSLGVNTVELSIYNLLGESVKTLVSDRQTTGLQTVFWDGTSNEGIQMPSGEYFCRLEVDGKFWIKKIVLVQ